MADVEIWVEGGAGRITLNRLDALNALNRPMMDAIDTTLIDWADDAAVRMVIIDAVGERAFCAGGDIAEFHRRTQEGDFAFGRDFWRDEYRLNARIKNYEKPYVAIMDGIVMGGGVGLSAHGSHRIVTEHSMVAMPECMIGLIPDVGGSLLLGRAPGHLGEYLGLTGARMGADDAIFAGFADFFVPSAKLPELIAALIEAPDPAVIDRFAETPPDGELRSKHATIDRIFAQDELSAMVNAFTCEAAGDWCEKARKSLAKGCPLSLHCTLRMVREARGMTSLEQALAQEYRYTWRSLEQGEFMEGIRAVVIDKDREPRWAKPSIGDVTKGEVDDMLASLGDDELTF